MIDRVRLSPGESYQFQTDGGQYVVVVNVSSSAVEVLKGDDLLARLNYLENYSCPANTGAYIIRNINTRNSANVLLVRYILL
jgi:hypothetical protein